MVTLFEIQFQNRIRLGNKTCLWLTKHTNMWYLVIYIEHLHEVDCNILSLRARTVRYINDRVAIALCTKILMRFDNN